ncbi:MAG: Mut7-C RNAse domain-containing protein [Pseudomonadota bacterium]
MSPGLGPAPVLLTERMLGRLATWLRILGYDAPQIQRPPAMTPPGAVLLTRRRRLAGRPGVLLVEHDRLEGQLRQVLGELGLRPDQARFFRRCLRCNTLVEPLERGQAWGLVPEHTLATAEGFTRCPVCGRVYWPGSHGARAMERIKALLAGLPEQAPTTGSGP